MTTAVSGRKPIVGLGHPVSIGISLEISITRHLGHLTFLPLSTKYLVTLMIVKFVPSTLECAVCTSKTAASEIVPRELSRLIAGIYLYSLTHVKVQTLSNF